MKTVLFRTGSGSIPVQTPVVPGSTKVSVTRESIGKVFNGEKKKKKGCSSPMISLNLEINRRNIRRASSESDVIRSAFGSKQDELEVLRSIGSLSLTEDRRSYAGDWPLNGIPIDEVGFPGGGIGNNRKFDGGENSDAKKLEVYYKEMLNSNPMNSLLLRNYGKYLHEVEGDFAKAEEYYERAILASPGDGEVLSLYGKLIWETQRDENRAKSYFDQAVQASPDDCTVLGSYAHFMWEADEDENEDENEKEEVTAVASMVAVY